MHAVRLFTLGFLGLFLELALIRYLSGSIWNLGYFPNLVLLSAFLGLGMGFVMHRRLSPRASDRAYVGASLVLLALVCLVAWQRPVVPGLLGKGAEIGGELYFTATPAHAAGSGWAVFPICFVAIVAVFAMIAQRTAKVFRELPPLTAYTWDIAGSCAGIVVFMALSWLEAPAWSWFVLAIAPFVVGADPALRIWRWLPVLPLAAVAALTFLQDGVLTMNPKFAGELEVRWSPYQKVERIRDPRMPAAQGIFVNGVAHQVMRTKARLRDRFYQRPYEHRAEAGRPPPRSVLVIGAGSGNDVAVALMRGAERIDAVEIDPVIARFGREHHPARPYQDPRVRLIIDDARAWMTRTTEKYDLVIFALTDSLVKVSSMAQLRLENYVFTVDAIRRAFELLTDDGEIVLYNYYRRTWLVEKFQRMVHAATGRWPRLLISTDDFAMLGVAKADPPAEAPTSAERVDVPTDDWPFPYLKEHGIPPLYAGALGVAGVLVVVLGLALRRRSPRGGVAPVMAFFLMGAAFLLLETKSIVQFSLLFGTTWENTSLVFLAVLALVLAANATARVLDRRALQLIVALLLASCVLTLIFPLSNLLAVESRIARFVLASLMTFSPIYFANLIFSVTFRDQEVPEHLFGWNLVGATAGGLIEYTSMAIGYNALAAIVALCYALAYALLVGYPRRRSARM